MGLQREGFLVGRRRPLRLSQLFMEKTKREEVTRIGESIPRALLETLQCLAC
jgi:hypothetical protein